MDTLTAAEQQEAANLTDRINEPAAEDPEAIMVNQLADVYLQLKRATKTVKTLMEWKMKEMIFGKARVVHICRIKSSSSLDVSEDSSEDSGDEPADNTVD